MKLSNLLNVLEPNIKLRIINWDGILLEYTEVEKISYLDIKDMLNREVLEISINSDGMVVEISG